MTPAIRRSYEWLTIAVLFGAAVVAVSVRKEPSWITTDQLFLLLHGDVVLLDISSERLYASRTIPGSVNIPQRELGRRLRELSRTTPIVVFGKIGNDSEASYHLLRERGYPVYDLGPMSRMPRGMERHMHHGESGGEHVHPGQ